LFKTNMCYTFIISSPHLRVTGVPKEDMKMREEDLKYGVYHFTSRHICPNQPSLHLVESPDSILGVRHCMIRTFRNLDEMHQITNLVGTGNVGSFTQEVKPGEEDDVARLSCRRIFSFTPFWTCIYQLKNFNFREIALNYNKIGYLERKLDDEDFEFVKDNLTAMDILTEMIAEKHISPIQSYASLRNRYYPYMQWITECIVQHVTQTINDELGEEPDINKCTDDEIVEDFHERKAKYITDKKQIEQDFLSQSSVDILGLIIDRVSDKNKYEEWWEKHTADIEALYKKQNPDKEEDKQ